MQHMLLQPLLDMKYVVISYLRYVLFTSVFDSSKGLIKNCIIQVLWNFFTIAIQNSDTTAGRRHSQVNKTEY